MAFREAKPFLFTVALLSLLGFWLHPALAVPALALFLYVLWFFRDPRRTPPPE
ncbi:MAG: phosphatidylserine decarboxylase family protein, partial [Bdellovibrionaceae bacterium]|nr:phosphatidylserine decarboxylase family protein [Pseudobdellovibrionaceae bacterium]